jgi:putative zinc finger/helix-turn-helix YgiT family protein
MVRPRRCAECRQGEVHSVVEPYATDMEHDGRSYSLSVGPIEIKRCEKCGSQVLPDDSFEVVLNALRTAAGLLMPAEIRAKRESFGYSRTQFATLLGVAPATISRWESGGQIQQRNQNDRMVSFFDVPELRAYLEKKHGITSSLLSIKQQEAENALATMV